MGRLTQMEAFARIAESGSLQAAAKRLGISAAAISKQLSSLEKELGVQLITRSTRHLALTDIGKRYLQQALRILEEVATSDALISEMKEIPKGTIKVVSGRHFAQRFITPHIKTFLQCYPEIHLNLELAERIPDFATEDIDLLIGMSLPNPESTIQRRIATTRYVLAASPSYLAQNGRPKRPQDLTRHHYLTHSMRMPNDTITFANGKSIRVVPYLYVNDTDTLAQLALDGLGIIKVHQYVVEEAVRQGTLEEILPGSLLQQIPIFLAYPERRFLPQKVRAFIDFILDYALTARSV